MSSEVAFFPASGPSTTPSAALTVTGTSVTALLPASGDNVVLYNASTVQIGVAFGAVGVVAAIPTVGVNTATAVIPPGAVYTLKLPANAVAWAAVGASGTIYLLQGEGI